MLRRRCSQNKNHANIKWSTVYGINIIMKLKKKWMIKKLHTDTFDAILINCVLLQFHAFPKFWNLNSKQTTQENHTICIFEMLAFLNYTKQRISIFGFYTVNYSLKCVAEIFKYLYKIDLFVISWKTWCPFENYTVFVRRLYCLSPSITVFQCFFMCKQWLWGRRRFCK